MPINVQPTIMRTPPTGVMAPSFRNDGERISFSDRIQRDTLKMNEPKIISLVCNPFIVGAMFDMASKPSPLSAKYSDAVFQTSR